MHPQNYESSMDFEIETAIIGNVLTALESGEIDGTTARKALVTLCATYAWRTEGYKFMDIDRDMRSQLPEFYPQENQT